MATNKFIERWKLDDKEWVSERKKEWIFFKDMLRNDLGLPSRNVTELKKYYLTGAIPPKTIKRGSSITSIEFTPFHKLLLTPAESTNDVVELLESMSPDDRSMTGGAGLVAKYIDTENGLKFPVDLEKYIAKANCPDEYTEIYDRNYKGDTIMVNYPAEKVILRFEHFAFRYLAEEKINYSPIKCVIKHYASCLEHLKKEDKAFNHYEWFKALVTVVFNYVPVREFDEDNAETLNFVNELKQVFLSKSIPTITKEIVSKLGEKKIEEYSLDYPKTYGPSIGMIKLPSKGSIRGAFAVQHLAPSKALKIFLKSAELIGGIESSVVYEDLDISSLLTLQGAKSLGYQKDEPIPAVRCTLWLTPNVNISNSPDGKLGADLIFPIAKTEDLNINKLTVIHFPRLSSYYENIRPSATLVLVNYLFKSQFFKLSGECFVKYAKKGEDRGSHRFFEKFFVDKRGYDLLTTAKDFQLQTLAINGPPVKPWQGEPLTLFEEDK